MKNELRGIIDRSITTAQNKNLLAKYNENWYVQRMATVNIRRLEDEELRRLIQPTHGQLVARSESLQTAIQVQQILLQNLKTEAKGHAWKMFTEPLAGVWTCLLWVWMIGLTIETIALGVLTATNIQKLREQGQTATVASS